jgi:hypothetical protein
MAASYTCRPFVPCVVPNGGTHLADDWSLSHRISVIAMTQPGNYGGAVILVKDVAPVGR